MHTYDPSFDQAKPEVGSHGNYKRAGKDPRVLGDCKSTRPLQKKPAASRASYPPPTALPHGIEEVVSPPSTIATERRLTKQERDEIFAQRQMSSGAADDNASTLIENLPSHILQVHMPWAEQIVAGTKIWEIRSQATNMRGRVAIGIPVVRHIIGEVFLEDCVDVTHEDFGKYVRFHGIDDLQKSPAANYAQIHAWVLARPTPYSSQIGYKCKPGAIGWVKLESCSVFPIQSQAGEDSISILS